jgi:hypothetical protein
MSPDIDPKTIAKMQEAARRAVAQAPPLIPGSPLWRRLAAIIAEIPDEAPASPPAEQAERTA